MKRIRLAAPALLALALAFWSTGCTAVTSHAARTWQPQTYAIVVADDQGVLSQAVFKRVEIAIVQYLIGGGFVRSDERYVGDLMRADVVFRVKIAWQDSAAGSFSVAEIAPSYGNGAPAAVAVVEPAYDPWYYDQWYYDPWFYGDYYSGYYYGPWSPFLGVAAFLPIYGIDHPRRSLPPVAHRPSTDEKRRGRHPAPPNGYTRYAPRQGETGTPPNQPPGYRRVPSAPDNTRPARPAPTTTRRRDNDTNRTTPSPDRSSWRSRPTSPSTPAAPPDTSARRQRNPDSSSRSSTGHGRDSGSGSRHSPRSSDSAPSSHSGPSPSRDHSPSSSQSYSAPSYSSPPASSAPSYSSPPASSPPPSSSSSGSGGDRDTNSRTTER
jgi:hypothetical protein